MDIIIYIGIAVIVIGLIVLGISIWALITHREKKYKELMNEHIAQKNRVQTKLKKKDDREQ